MKLTLTTFIMLALAIMNVHAVPKKITTNDFIVQYEEGTENYAKASIKILKVVKSNAIKMGFTFPGKIELHIVKSDKNMLYVRGDIPDLITWEFKSMNDFLAPMKSGYNNVYGLCHEMGHLCMSNILNGNNNWMTRDCREGWANYFGSLMIEHVNNDIGVKVWPDQHDYHASRGMQSFLKSVNSNHSKKEKGFFYCSQFWYNLSSLIGHKNVCNFFYTINVIDINNSNSNSKFLDLLKTYNPGKDFIADFQKNKSYLIVEKKVL